MPGHFAHKGFHPQPVQAGVAAVPRVFQLHLPAYILQRIHCGAERVLQQQLQVDDSGLPERRMREDTDHRSGERLLPKNIHAGPVHSGVCADIRTAVRRFVVLHIPVRRAGAADRLEGFPGEEDAEPDPLWHAAVVRGRGIHRAEIFRFDHDREVHAARLCGHLYYRSVYTDGDRGAAERLREDSGGEDFLRVVGGRQAADLQHLPQVIALHVSHRRILFPQHQHEHPYAAAVFAG